LEHSHIELLRGRRRRRRWRGRRGRRSRSLIRGREPQIPELEHKREELEAARCSGRVEHASDGIRVIIELAAAGCQEEV
jgi:hypothetical protein